MKKISHTINKDLLMINIFAPVNLLGYGIHAINLMKALSEKDQELCLAKIGQPQVDPFFETYWQTAEKNFVEKFDAKNPSVFIFHDEYSFQSCGKPLLTFSVFETDQLKPMSFQMLEHGPSNIILTTTNMHKQILEINGITKPIEVVNEGIDPAIFNTVEIDKHIDTGKFTYITVGKKEERKKTNMILDTFMSVMADKEVALIAHTFNGFENNVKDHPFTNLICWSDINPKQHGFEYKGFDGKAHKFTKDNCDIYFTVPGIQTVEMPCLYQSANVGIQVSRAEGWDLPLGEMMACGLPCIATDCLGHSEYIEGTPQVQKDLIVRVQGIEPAVDGKWFKGDQGNWGIVEQADVTAQLLRTYEEKDKYQDKSEELSTYMADNYSWTKAAEKLLEIIDRAQ